MTAEPSSGARPQVIWARRSETTPFSPAPGVEVRPVIGESLMTCWIIIQPGAEIPEHAHINEQLGVVVEGSIAITANGESRTLEVGDAYVVTPDLPHRAIAGPNGVVLVETFVPVREDYKRAWEAAGRR